MAQDDGDDDEIGYGRPPKHTQFRKGRSGNPTGRRKHIRNIASDIHDELLESITLRENGKERRVSKQRAFVKALVAAAIRGDVRAINAVVGLSRTVAGPLQAAVDPDELEEDLHILKTYVDRELRRKQNEHAENLQDKKSENSPTPTTRKSK